MKSCRICGKPAQWKVRELVEDKTGWVCQEHLQESLPRSPVLQLAWLGNQEKRESA